MKKSIYTCDLHGCDHSQEADSERELIGEHRWFTVRIMELQTFQYCCIEHMRLGVIKLLGEEETK